MNYRGFSIIDNMAAAAFILFSISGLMRLDLAGSRQMIRHQELTIAREILSHALHREPDLLRPCAYDYDGMPVPGSGVFSLRVTVEEHFPIVRYHLAVHWLDADGREQSLSTVRDVWRLS